MNEKIETHLAVGIELWSVNARALIRTAAATAAELRRPWVAIVVSNSAHRPAQLTADELERWRQNTDLIQSLGGSSVFCEGDDIGRILAETARAFGADTLLVAKPRTRPRGALTRLVSPDVSDVLVHHPTPLRLLFVDTA